jgi:hypothetical protein
MTRSMLYPAACALLTFAGCKSHDLGKPCPIDSSGTLPTQPVGGESPLIEVVTVQRATQCDSFQCLQDRGYAPYCTRDCTVDTGGKVGPSCSTSADCTQPQHCFQGRCLGDDCPGGFECQQVQDVGPLADRLFCIYKEHCRSNRECEDLGTMECARMGCFDSTLQSGVTTAAPTLVCERRDKMNCLCGDGSTSCSGTALTCYGGPSQTQWPSGSVEIRDVCMRPGT